jgi:hypothetical protein
MGLKKLKLTKKTIRNLDVRSGVRTGGKMISNSPSDDCHTNNCEPPPGEVTYTCGGRSVAATGGCGGGGAYAGG